MALFTLRTGIIGNYYILIFEDIHPDWDAKRGQFTYKEPTTKFVIRSAENPEFNIAGDTLFLPGTHKTHDKRLMISLFKDLNQVIASEERMLQALSIYMTSIGGAFIHLPFLII